MIHISVQLREHHPNYGYLLTYDVETNTLDEFAGLPEHLIQYNATHLYNWVEITTARGLLKCLFQEHIVMIPAKAQA